MRWSAAQTLSWIIQHKALPLKSWTDELGPKLSAAEIELAAAIKEGRVGARGRPTPCDPQQAVPPDIFGMAALQLVVGAYGELKSSPPHKFGQCEKEALHGWRDIEFDRKEIQGAWPEPPPVELTEWLEREARRTLNETGCIEKRESLLRRCRTETGCKKRAAEAAHKRLPHDLRLPRGRKM
jgi:hypothetical protein